MSTYFSFIGKRQALGGLLILVLAAAAWSVLASTHLFPYFSVNNDEPVYLAQAETLMQGRLAEPKTAQSDFLINWFQADRNEKLTYKYTPVHALWLALCRWLFGTFHAALALTAALNVFLLYALARETGVCRRTALLAAACFLASPIFLAASATYLSYSSFLFLLLAFGVLFARAQRTRSFGAMLGAGVCLGIGFFARPFDAALVGAAFLIPYFLAKKTQVLRPLAVLAFGFFPFAALMALFNYSQTGNPFLLPFFMDPSDTFGFGLKRADPSHQFVLYDLETAVRSLGISFWRSSYWTFGGLITYAFALYYGLAKRRNDLDLSLILIAFLIPAGYFFFWGSFNGISAPGFSSLGPNYYLPLLVPASILGARYFAALARGKTMLRVGLLGLMLIPTTFCFARFLQVNTQLRDTMRTVYAPIERSDLADSLVFVPPVHGPYLLNPFPHLRNSIESKARGTLFVVDRNVDNFRLWDELPSLKPFRFEFFGVNSPVMSDLVPLTREVHPRWRFQLRVKNPTDRSVVDLLVKSGPTSRRLNLARTSVKHSHYVVKFEVNDKSVTVRVAGSATAVKIPLTLGQPLHFGAEFKHQSERYPPLYFGFHYLFRKHPAGGFQVIEPPVRTGAARGQAGDYLSVIPQKQELIGSFNAEPVESENF